MANVRTWTMRAAVAAVLAAGSCARAEPHVLTFSGSLVGREGDVIRRQLDRFREANPSIDVALRATPDAADQRHQLYVQWLNARASDPDVLQLDVVWTPEFAAAGWIAGLDRFEPRVDQFFAAAVAVVQLVLQDILVASHRYPMHIVALAGVQVPVPSQDPKPV